jgi:2-C-methyl-D-erythritol 2,4-cyclodiphosphate synthase
MRIGIGYDIHRLIEGRPLILGGVDIPFNYGLDGHSDADALTHAVIDAILGAAGLGDIGGVFGVDRPDTHGIASLTLLKRTMELVARGGWLVNNIDATIIAEKPRLGPHVPAMRQNLAGLLGVDPNRVNVKASTAQGLGEIGSVLAIAVYAAVTLEEPLETK